MKPCETIREWMSEELDGALDGTHQAALREHLAACPACAKEFADLKAAVQMVRDLPEVEPPADLLERVHAQLEAERPARSPVWNLFARPPIQLALAAALLLGLGIYGYIEFTAPRPVPELQAPATVAEAPAANRQQLPQTPVPAAAPADEATRAAAPAVLKEQARSPEEPRYRQPAAKATAAPEPLRVARAEVKDHDVDGMADRTSVGQAAKPLADVAPAEAREAAVAPTATLKDAAKPAEKQAEKKEDSRGRANAAVRGGMGADKADAGRSAGPGFAEPAAAPAPVVAKPAPRVAPPPAPAAPAAPPPAAEQVEGGLAYGAAGAADSVSPRPSAAIAAPREALGSSALRRSVTAEEEAKRVDIAAAPAAAAPTGAPMRQGSLAGAGRGREELLLDSDALTAAPPAGAGRKKAEAAAPAAAKALLADSAAQARPCVVRLAAAERAAVAKVVEEFRAQEAKRSRALAPAAPGKPQAADFKKGQPEAAAAAEADGALAFAGAEAGEKKAKGRQAPTFAIQIRASQVPDLVARLGKLGAIAVENAPSKAARESEDLAKPGLHAVEPESAAADELVTVQIYLVTP